MDTRGCGNATYRLHLGLKRLGIDSKILVVSRRLSDPDVVSLRQNLLLRIKTKIINYLISKELKSYIDRPSGLEIFSDDRTPYTVSKHPLVQEADIVVLRWIAGMVDYREFFRGIKHKPLIWRLSDMNPFTGGCHVAGDCRRYEVGCGVCPQLKSKNRHDLSYKIFRRKRTSYQYHHPHIVAPSLFLKDLAERSMLLGNFKIHVIPNALPIETFMIRSKKTSRELLNLPKDKTIILFGAVSRSGTKGFEHLVQALHRIKHKSQIALVTFGNCTDRFPTDLGFPCFSVGYICNETVLSQCYSAADIFVWPSLQESFGQTWLESMSCGVPVVAYRTGGVPETIVDYETGLTVDVGNIEGLSQQIEWMIVHPKEREQMGTQARKLVEQKFSLEIQARRYDQLFKSILS